MGTSTPSLAVIQTWLRQRAPNAYFSNASDLDAAEWTQVELLYKADKQPIIVECNRDDGCDSLVRLEVAEFIELIGEPGHSASKRRVLNHLAATKFIIVCQFLSDMDEDGYEANFQFMNYFVEHCDGIIHADGEGFYDGDKIIVEVK